MPRGRPKGSKNISQKQVIIQTTNLQQEKRGRGRPKKIVVQNISIVQNGQQPNLSQQEKRGRGRPKKIIEQNIELKNDKVTESIKNIQSANSMEEFHSTEKKIIHIPTLKEEEYQKNSSIKSTYHESIIYEEFKQQKSRNYQMSMSKEGVWKQNISKLQDAYVIKLTEFGREFTFTSKVGEKILIEYPQNWRKTETWIIDEINESTGDLRLKHFTEGYYGGANYITGPTIYGIKIKKA